MPAFVVDPLVVTVPPPECGDETLIKWLKTLELWLGEVQSSPFPWLHFLECTHRLQEINRFPTFTTLRDLARTRKLDINVRRLMVGVDSFFQDESKDILAETTTRYALVEEEAPEIVPAEFISRNEPPIHETLMNALFCLACDRAAGNDFARSIHVATLPLEGEVRSLVVRGTLALTEPEEVADQIAQGRLDEIVPVLYNPDDFQTRVEDILEGGFDVFRAAVVRLARRLYRDGTILPFSAGSEFWRSLRVSTINTNQSAVEKLLRICAAMVAGHLDELMSELRPVRTSVGPQSAQRIRQRDGARGWRLIITKKGIGWRLHYWHVPARHPHQAECIELANVIRMQEVPRIPE